MCGVRRSGRRGCRHGALSRSRLPKHCCTGALPPPPRCFAFSTRQYLHHSSRHVHGSACGLGIQLAVLLKNRDDAARELCVESLSFLALPSCRETLSLAPNPSVSADCLAVSWRPSCACYGVFCVGCCYTGRGLLEAAVFAGNKPSAPSVHCLAVRQALLRGIRDFRFDSGGPWH